ncbi:MAG: response regulator [Anaerolineae bacterium]|nr:MAG: response regulator [Anaerolineae bacterium]
MQPMELIEILLVEDNPGDIRLTQEALGEGRLLNRLHVVMDGEEALDFLHQRGKYAQAVWPDLILLDLNLPKLNGQEVLAAVKGDPKLRKIPVIVLTTSEAEKDILHSYSLHANSYIVKPVSLEKFVKVIASLRDYWFSVVKLPPSGER